MWRCINSVMVLLSSALVAGCASTTSSTGLSRSVVPVSNTTIVSLYKSANCESISRKGFMLVSDNVMLQDLLAPLGLAANDIAQVDFQRHQVLVVDFGAQPTAGFDVSLASNTLQAEAGKAVVRVNMPERTTQKRQAQVVSHPCGLYLLPRSGQQTVEIRSQFNDVLTRFSME